MAKATCSDRECRNEVYARGLCQTHYGIAWRRGELPRNSQSNSCSGFIHSPTLTGTPSWLTAPYAGTGCQLEFRSDRGVAPKFSA